MEVSKVLGVKVGEEFRVNGFSSVFRVVTYDGNREYLETKFTHEDNWKEAKLPTVYEILYLAPDNIIHLPPPLTDEQREQLKAIWTLGGKWIAKDIDGTLYAYIQKPEKGNCVWLTGGKCFYMLDSLHVASLVSWPDPEPYDIAKALEIKR